MPSANFIPGLFQQVSKHPASGKWIVEMQFINAAHKREI